MPNSNADIMRILFITGLYPKEEEFYLNSLSRIGIQNAANVFQWAIVNGLAQNNADFEVISCPFLPAYPLSFRKCFTPASDIVLNHKLIGSMLSYCDLMGYKAFSIKRVIFKYIRSWAEKNVKSGEQLVLLSYSPYPSFFPCLKILKKKYNLIVASIVTDLVDDMLNFQANRTLLKRLQTNIIAKQTRALYPLIDKYILLSEHMVEKIPNSINKHIVVEGIAENKKEIESKQESEVRSFLYTGTLEFFSCIDSLVRAFMRIHNPNIRLIICGEGPLSKIIYEYSKCDARIDFRGIVHREEAIRLQKESTIVVNPRKPDGGITKYSFPSKTMEYLSSGTPMLGYKLEGIPEEYYSYYYTINDMSEESLSIVMSDVISKPQEELNEKAYAAYCFVQKNKTTNIQVKRIIEFLNN